MLHFCKSLHVMPRFMGNTEKQGFILPVQAQQLTLDFINVSLAFVALAKVA